MPTASKTAEAPREIKTLVRRVYFGCFSATGGGGGLVGRLHPLVHYPSYLLLWRRATRYLSDGVRVAGENIVSVSNRITGSEMVVYWKDFIRGIPEYSALVRAKKFIEIQNILITLADQNEVLQIHQEYILDIQAAMKELQDEEQAS